jgi:hypothetical protein
MTYMLLARQQNPAAAPKNGSLLAVEPLLAAQQPVAATAAAIAAPATAGAAKPVPNVAVTNVQYM